MLIKINLSRNVRGAYKPRATKAQIHKRKETAKARKRKKIKVVHDELIGFVLLGCSSETEKREFDRLIYRYEYNINV